MKMARVIGTVVSTIKMEPFGNYKLQLVQPVDSAGVPTSETSFVAADAAQAGVGDYVLVVEEGKSARQVLGNEQLPCEAFIVGVIDYITSGGQQHPLRPPALAAPSRAGRG